ncbi:MAG: glycosyltransferase family 2 protein [Putridiphycobacter sp.]
MDKIIISIITISYNNINGLKKTIDNVFNQNINILEHIIIDGNSNDGTKTYLKSIEKNYLKWVSEKDKGIYDAMNKGIKMAKGEWVIFMNAGDIFANTDIVSDFYNQNFTADLVYGNCKISYTNQYSRISKPNALNTLWKGMSFSHQTVFIKCDIIIQNKFDTTYKYCADFNQIFQLFLKHYKFEFWDNLIAIIEAGGISDTKRYISTNEVYKINRRLEPKLKKHFYFVPKIILGYLISKTKLILPRKTISFFTKLKYK